LLLLLFLLVQHAELLPHVVSGIFVAVGIWEVVATSTWGLCNSQFSLQFNSEIIRQHNTKVLRVLRTCGLAGGKNRGQGVKGQTAIGKGKYAKQLKLWETTTCRVIDEALPHQSE